LDDDDEFTEDHIERLLRLALDTQSELAYGALKQINQATGEEQRIFSSPPKFGGIGLQGALYLRLLSDIFHYDFHSYLLDEVADWTMIRRMMESGVTIASTGEYVGTLNMVPPGHPEKDY
jgi:hypothetical protein